MLGSVFCVHVQLPVAYYWCLGGLRGPIQGRAKAGVAGSCYCVPQK